MATATASLAKLIDLGLHHPALTDVELRAGCENARRLGLAAVCVKPHAVKLAAEILRGADVAVGTVISFPHGSSATQIKAAEAQWACDQGAVELDMVVNVGKALSGDWDYVERDVKAVLDVARRNHALLKVIFENDYLQDDAVKIKLCEICGRLGVDFVKTSTGYGYLKQADGNFRSKGATEHDVALMRKHSPPNVQIKAAGGIHTQADALKLIELGCTRLGVSNAEAILAADKTNHDEY